MSGRGSISWQPAFPPARFVALPWLIIHCRLYRPLGGRILPFSVDTVSGLGLWARQNRTAIEDARLRFDAAENGD
jgi:hypothetical protein